MRSPTMNHWLAVFALTLAIFAAAVVAQTNSPAQQQDQIPDAPSANRPPAAPFPANTAPAPKSGPATEAQPEAPAENPAPSPAPVKTVPPGQTTATGSDRNSRDEFKLVVNVPLVVVPVTVKDGSGHLVPGLLKKDFSILENGVPENIKLFTSDPFPLSVAVVLDSNLPNETMKKVSDTLSALTGSFSEFDEVGVFTYGNTVQQQLDFTGSSQKMVVALRRAEQRGRTNGPPVVSGSMTGGPSPSINGRPFDPSTPHVSNVHRESSVLNDAILAAANALSTRDRARRKIIFVISDGREDGSNASYSDVLKVLLSNDVSIYAIAVDAAAIPGYNTLEKVRLPMMGYGNILPKYVSATGGEVFAEFTRDSIESAYSRLTEQARNQYTLGYTTRGTAAGDYRSIEVRVHRPGLEVHAKDGYYPLPPQH